MHEGYDIPSQRQPGPESPTAHGITASQVGPEAAKSPGQPALQVGSEAQKIEGLAQQFLGGNDETGAFQKFSDEILATQKQGMPFAKAVFDQIKQDNSGINFLPHVDVNDLGNGNLQLYMSPPLVDTSFGMNYRDIGAIVAPDSSFTDAQAGRNSLVGQQTLNTFTQD